MSDRLPPHNIEAEQSFLGCIMLDPKAALTEIRVLVESPDEFFYDLRHSTIFKAISELSEENKPVDLITIQERLKSRNELEAVGGIPYLSALPDAPPSAANIGYYAEILEEKADQRKLLAICTNIARAVLDGETGPEIIDRAEREILSVRRRRKGHTVGAKDLVSQAIADIEELHLRQGRIGGTSTGLVDLDHITDGLHSDEMIVVAGFPGAGKSALAMNIAEHVAVDLKLPVGVFSLEMSARRLMMRLLASRGRVNLRSIKNGRLAEADFKRLSTASAKFVHAPLYFCELADLTITQLRSRARQLVQQHGIKLFVIDYLQLLTSPGKKESREQEVANISRNIKMMAQEFGVPVIALSQLNEDGKLRESRAIGQDADTVWRLRSKEKEAPEGPIVTMVLEILKQRDGEAPCSIDLTFLKTFTRFECASRTIPVDV